MSDFISFIEVTGAVLASLGLAMSLEWLTLNGLFRVMPSLHSNEAQRRPAKEARGAVTGNQTLHMFSR
jgi:hypothetical protein